MIDQTQRKTVRVGGGEPPVDVTDRPPATEQQERPSGTIVVVCIDSAVGDDGLWHHRLTQLLGNGALAAAPKELALMFRNIAEQWDPEPKIALATTLPPPNGRA